MRHIYLDAMGRTFQRVVVSAKLTLGGKIDRNLMLLLDACDGVSYKNLARKYGMTVNNVRHLIYRSANRMLPGVDVRDKRGFMRHRGWILRAARRTQRDLQGEMINAQARRQTQSGEGQGR